MYYYILRSIYVYIFKGTSVSICITSRITVKRWLLAGNSACKTEREWGSFFMTPQLLFFLPRMLALSACTAGLCSRHTQYTRRCTSISRSLVVTQ